ncbi:RNA methyltransferase family protein [Klebsormidium nitens]|uniref:RNA methyltransferase family protein n=1 Tax=Klebsormidium nitens TaxID=105231 RepID=A0A1Y1IGR7_KLENI|nr:RNA methyltransferase family protein [Klebsormidium nitens]|eukprot:GAQ90060.1 RNA methyltransferase family protein [Klebsormidium nitens]
MLRLAALRARGIQTASLGVHQVSRNVRSLFEAVPTESFPIGRQWRHLNAAAASDAAIVDVLDESVIDSQSTSLSSSSDLRPDTSQLDAAAQEHELGPEGHSENLSEMPSETPSNTLSEIANLSSETLMGAAEKAAAAAVLPKTKPIHPKQNSELELVCESLAYGGAAVCKVPETGFVLMVNGALPGERLLARVMRKKRSMAQAVKLRTLEPPPNLVEPPCQHATDCGGCKTQNWAYESQVAEKQKQVEELIIRVGRFPRGSGWMKPAVPCEQRFNYRNKMEFSFGNRIWTAVAPGKAPRTAPGTAKPPPQRGTDFGLGLHAPGRFDKILPIDECWLQDAAANRVLRIVAEWARGSQAECPVYDSVTHDGFLRHLTIRKGSDTDTGAVRLMVNIQTAGSQPELLQPVVDRLVAEVPEVASVVNNVNDSPGCGSVGKQEHLLYGKPYIKERLRGLEFEISANSFFQTNTNQAEVLYGLVEDACGLSGEKSEVILDLFCGTGTIGLSMAHRAKHVYGYELVPEAVADAVRNAERNGIQNATFIQGDLNKLKEDFGRQFQTPDVVITDPNRPGMHPKLLRFLSECGARRIVYVSCNPSTQARDLDVLCHGEDNRGEGVGPYELVSVQPVDMFPHTSHIESVAVLDQRLSSS